MSAEVQRQENETGHTTEPKPWRQKTRNTLQNVQHVFRKPKGEGDENREQQEPAGAAKESGSDEQTVEQQANKENESGEHAKRASGMQKLTHMFVKPKEPVEHGDKKTGDEAGEPSAKEEHPEPSAQQPTDHVDEEHKKRASGMQKLQNMFVKPKDPNEQGDKKTGDEAGEPSAKEEHPEPSAEQHTDHVDEEHKKRASGMQKLQNMFVKPKEPVEHGDKKAGDEAGEPSAVEEHPEASAEPQAAKEEQPGAAEQKPEEEHKKRAIVMPKLPQMFGKPKDNGASADKHKESAAEEGPSAVEEHPEASAEPQAAKEEQPGAAEQKPDEEHKKRAIVMPKLPQMFGKPKENGANADKHQESTAEEGPLAVEEHPEASVEPQAAKENDEPLKPAGSMQKTKDALQHVFGRPKKENSPHEDKPQTKENGADSAVATEAEHADPPAEAVAAEAEHADPPTEQADNAQAGEDLKKGPSGIHIGKIIPKAMKRGSKEAPH